MTSAPRPPCFQLARRHRSSPPPASGRRGGAWPQARLALRKPPPRSRVRAGLCPEARHRYSLPGEALPSLKTAARCGEGWTRGYPRRLCHAALHPLPETTHEPSLPEGVTPRRRSHAAGVRRAAFGAGPLHGRPHGRRQGRVALRLAEPRRRSPPRPRRSAMRILGAGIPAMTTTGSPREAAPELANDPLPGHLAMEPQVHDGQVEPRRPGMVRGFSLGPGLEDAEALGAEQCPRRGARAALHPPPPARSRGVLLIHGVQTKSVGYQTLPPRW